MSDPTKEDFEYIQETLAEAVYLILIRIENISGMSLRNVNAKRKHEVYIDVDGYHPREMSIIDFIERLELIEKDV